MTIDELAAQHKKLQADVAGLCKLFQVQQQALELLTALVDCHQRTIEAAGYTPPAPSAASN